MGSIFAYFETGLRLFQDSDNTVRLDPFISPLYRTIAMSNSIDIKELADFLTEANKSTYANKDASKTISQRLKSKDYHFKKGNLIYHDTYFGERNFIGEGIIYKDQNPVWGANYFAFVLNEEVAEKNVYGFLRKALMQEYDGIIPVRGPKKFSDGEWNYQFSAKGNLENFSGQEEILLNMKIVYRCLIHGGFIRNDKFPI